MGKMIILDRILYSNNKSNGEDERECPTPLKYLSLFWELENRPTTNAAPYNVPGGKRTTLKEKPTPRHNRGKLVSTSNKFSQKEELELWIILWKNLTPSVVKNDHPVV